VLARGEAEDLNLLRIQRTASYSRSLTNAIGPRPNDGERRSDLQTFHGHREVDNQAIGLPVVGKLAAKVIRDEPACEHTSKPLAVWRTVDQRTAILLPCQLKLVALQGRGPHLPATIGLDISGRS
jgi:hypothetical protein